MHLSESQAKRFAKLFFSLLSFVDEEYDPLAELAERGGPGNPFNADYFTPVIITEFCSFIFNAQREGRRDGVIDAFIAANPDGLSAEDLAQVAQWKDALNTPFFVVESSSESTVLMANGSLFSVTAVTRDACEVVGDAPAMIVATLLPFDGAIVVAGSIPSYPLDKRSGLQDKILLKGRKLRAAGHICSTAEELIHEAPLLRARSTRDHDESISLAVEDLVISALEKMQEEEPGKLLFDPADEDEDAFFASIPATHAGALAGLAPEDRAAAVTAHFEEFMADALQTMGEKVEGDYVRREQGCLKHARHLVEACLDLYGVIAVDDLTELYLSYYPEELGREDFEDFLEHSGPSSYAQYSMWIHQGETYVVNPLLVEQELIEEMVLDEAVFIDGDALGESDEPTEEELFRRHLLECRKGVEAWEIPAKTAEELEAYDVFHSLEELPTHRELQEYLDAHVPEGEDEYLYAAGVISELVQMVQFDLDPDDIFEELQDMGLFAKGIETPFRIVGLFVDFMIDIPRWTNNGWSQFALREHRLQ